MAVQAVRMKCRLPLTVLTLFLALTTGCSMTHGDPSNPAKNPHPVKRYEVTATSYAPGPWDSIEGYIGYDIINTKCMPRESFTGAQSLTSIGIDIEMTRVDDHTWKGYFYRDALQDEDYSGLGACHWDVTSVSVSAMAQGVRFAWSDLFDKLERGILGTSYFKKSVYGDRSFARYGVPDFTAKDSDVREHPGNYFRATIAVKEVAP
jgi:hypothetical protein